VGSCVVLSPSETLTVVAYTGSKSEREVLRRNMLGDGRDYDVCVTSYE